MNIGQRLLISAGIGTIALLLALPAGAKPHRDHHSPDGPGHHHPHPPTHDQPKDHHHPKIDEACRHDCREAALTCRAQAMTDARACVVATCPTELQNVHDACGTDPQSSACSTAVDALVQCLQPCVQALRSDYQNCRATAQSCIDACPTPGTNPTRKDPECVDVCEGVFKACHKAADDLSRACRNNCRPLQDLFEATCSDDDDDQGEDGDDEGDDAPLSDQCKALHQAAADCIHTCEQGHHDNTATCVLTGNSCISACPDVPQP